MIYTISIDNADLTEAEVVEALQVAFNKKQMNAVTITVIKTKKEK